MLFWTRLKCLQENFAFIAEFNSFVKSSKLFADVSQDTRRKERWIFLHDIAKFDLLEKKMVSFVGWE